MTLNAQTPKDTSHSLMVEALSRGDLDGAVSLYETGGTLIPQPGKAARGHGEIRTALQGFLALKPKFLMEANHTILVGDMALSITKWSLEGHDERGQPVQLGGTASDVLRRQPDGRWLFVLDNPWGTALLP